VAVTHHILVGPHGSIDNHTIESEESRKLINTYAKVCSSTIIKSAFGDKKFSIKCLRPYRQQPGFFMSCHHDTKDAGWEKVGGEGIVALIGLETTSRLPFQVISSSHQYIQQSDSNNSSFTDAKIKKLVKLGKLKSPVSLFLDPGDVLVFYSSLLHRDQPDFNSQLNLALKGGSRDILFIQLIDDISTSENISFSLSLLNSQLYDHVDQSLSTKSALFPEGGLSSLSLMALVRLQIHLLLNLPKVLLSSLRRKFMIFQATFWS